MKFRVPEIVLGALLAVAVVGVGMLFSSQHFQQGKGIDAKQGTAESVKSHPDAQHASPGEVKPVSQPEQASRHSDTYEIYGVKPGEFLLFLATVGLWYVTNQLVRDARQTAENQLRPYVHASQAYFEWNQSGARIIVKVLNTGQSPVTFYDVGGVSAVATRAVGHASSPRFVPINMEYGTWVSLGAGREESCIIRDKSAANTFAEHAREVLAPSSQKNFYILGRIRYGDVFGNEYESEFIFYTDNTIPNVQTKMLRATGRLRVYHKTKSGVPHA